MPLIIKEEQENLAAFLKGELDHHHTERLREEIDAETRAKRPKELILDFKEVEFMDSSGIGLVLGRYRLMQELEGKLVLRNLPRHLQRVMRVAGIGNLDIREEEKSDETK